MFAGFSINDWPSIEAHNDYFEVTVDKPGTLQVVLQPGPAAISITISAGSAPNTSLDSAFTIEDPVTIKVEAQPGKYYIRAQPVTSLHYTSDLGACAHCDTPYEFSTKLTYDDGSGEANEGCGDSAN